MTDTKQRIWTAEEVAEDHRQTEERNARVRAKELAERQAEALVTGKEPFDLDELAKYIDLAWRIEYAAYVPQVISREEKIEHYVYSYYVMYPRVLTLKEFAVKVEELRLWDLE